MKDLLKRYETIYGVFIGAIPSFMFQIFPPETTISFPLFLTIITLLLIINWFIFASRSHAINELDTAKAKLERMQEFQHLNLNITHLDWQEHKMKFTWNIDTNLLSNGQCIAIYYKKNGLDYLCGIGRIMQYNTQKKVAQANVIPLKSDDFNGELFPSKENVTLSPILNYDILNTFINNYGRSENE